MVERKVRRGSVGQKSEWKYSQSEVAGEQEWPGKPDPVDGGRDQGWIKRWRVKGL